MLDRPERSGSGDRVPLSDLFVGFLKVSLSGFGGGLVWARRAVVEQQQWMGEQEFGRDSDLFPADARAEYRRDRNSRIGGASRCAVFDQLWRVPDGSAGCS